MSYNANSGYGKALVNMVAAQVPAFGRIFVVLSPSDTSSQNYAMLSQIFKNDYDGNIRIFASNATDGTTPLEQAYAAVQSNNNDVILLDAHSSHSLRTGLAVTKSRVHFIGMDGGDRLVQQGAKIQNAAADATAYVIKVTGTRCSFRNIKFIQVSTAATALTVLQEGAEGTLYKNCSFVFGVPNNLGGTTAHEVLAGSDSATYLNCTFGCDTLLTSAARSVFHIDQVTTDQEFKSNILKGCHFIISSSSSTATFVRLDAIGDVLFSNLFEDCTFVASVDSAGGAAIAEASQTGTGTVKGGLFYVRPAVLNVSDFTTATGGRNANTQVVAAVSAAAAIEGIKPTA